MGGAGNEWVVCHATPRRSGAGVIGHRQGCPLRCAHQRPQVTYRSRGKRTEVHAQRRNARSRACVAVSCVLKGQAGVSILRWLRQKCSIVMTSIVLRPLQPNLRTRRRLQCLYVHVPGHCLSPSCQRPARGPRHQEPGRPAVLRAGRGSRLIAARRGRFQDRVGLGPYGHRPVDRPARRRRLAGRARGGRGTRRDGVRLGAFS